MTRRDIKAVILGQCKTNRGVYFTLPAQGGFTHLMFQSPKGRPILIRSLAFGHPNLDEEINNIINKHYQEVSFDLPSDNSCGKAFWHENNKGNQ